MRKNVSGQTIGAQMINATTGAAFTSAVTAYVTGDGGTQAAGSVGSGACTHEGNGYHSYAPAQAETNYDHVAVTFTGSGAIPVTVQVYTGFPQTVDNATNVAAIKAVTDLLPNSGALSSLAQAAAVATLQASTDDLPTNAELATALSSADDAVLAAIGDVPTNAELVSALAAADDAVLSAIADLPTNAELATALDPIPTAVEIRQEIDANSTKTGYRLSADGVDDVLDEVVDGAVSLRQSARLWNAALGAKASGLAGTTATYRDLADTKDRITATVDANGNRTAVARDLT
jgi:hypothetical protein